MHANLWHFDYKIPSLYSKTIITLNFYECQLFEHFETNTLLDQWRNFKSNGPNIVLCLRAKSSLKSLSDGMLFMNLPTISCCNRWGCKFFKLVEVMLFVCSKHNDGGCNKWTVSINILQTAYSREACFGVVLDVDILSDLNWYRIQINHTSKKAEFLSTITYCIIVINQW